MKTSKTSKLINLSPEAHPSKLRAQWIECLDSQDPNSIAHQLADLLYTAAVYDTINQWRTMARRAGDQLLVNPMLHRYIDRTFWISQIAGVRKLVDSFALRHQAGRDTSVFCLTALIKDMKIYYPSYFSRAAMFAAENLEYDIELLQSKEDAHTRRMIGDGQFSFAVPRECDPDPSCHRHLAIDRLTHKNASTRTPDDMVPEGVFDGLLLKITAPTESFVKLANKHTLHAASASSRESDEEYQQGMVLTLAELREAHEAICKTFRFVANDLLNQGEYDLLVERRIEDFRLFSLGHDIEGCEQFLIERWIATAAQIKGYTSWTIDELIPAQSPNTESENVS
jgi:hypothetical protein